MDRKLFLDDIRSVREASNYMSCTVRHNYHQPGWDVVKSYDEFVSYIERNGLPNLISFDHDLADEHYEDLLSDENFLKGDQKIILKYDAYKEKTGYEAAKWLIDYCLEHNEPLPDFLVHTMNPVGRKNIESLLTNFKNHQHAIKSS